MKKVILALSVIGFLTACGSSNETEAPKNDSTAVVSAQIETTPVVAVDSVKVGETGAVGTTGSEKVSTVK